MHVDVDTRHNATVIIPLGAHGSDAECLVANVHVNKDSEDAPFWRAISDHRVLSVLGLLDDDVQSKWQLLHSLKGCSIPGCPCGIFRLVNQKKKAARSS